MSEFERLEKELHKELVKLVVTKISTRDIKAKVRLQDLQNYVEEQINLAHYGSLNRFELVEEVVPPMISVMWYVIDNSTGERVTPYFTNEIVAMTVYKQFIVMDTYKESSYGE